MPVVVPPLNNTNDIELKETYIDEQGRVKERIQRVILPSFESTEDNSTSFNIDAMD